ncbi:MAG: TonB-dependent receptor plug domain-containing protein [Treponema sp.]|jgi:hypothetical protein|nr:TonB-dependent receptor plug domain-containing protein [Treponema sp.]
MKRFFILFALFISAISLFARDVTVYVMDTDIDLPLEGAVVRTWEGNEFICDRDGKVVFEVPENRQVIIQAAYPGYETGRLVIPVSGDRFTIALRLSGVIHGKELVVEASRPGTSDSRTGRSIAVSAKEIAQTAEIGIIEDVMSTIKLLPGVGHSGTFNAQPSIRGGHPGDMSASLDGFYINNPYHWRGGFSIFDPRMVQSAQLSHGVFSTRYGHTISGLLEISTKKPSVTETQLELGFNSSASIFNLSIPLAGKGGLLFMGRLTYYDPVIMLAQELSKYIPEFEAVNYINKAPYIGAGTITGNYRFTDKLELAATGFFGVDGLSALFENSWDTEALKSDTDVDVELTNFQGFFTSSLSWNPRNDMLFKLTGGVGYEEMIIDGRMLYRIHNKEFSDTFKNKYPTLISKIGITNYNYYQDALINQSDLTVNIQGRIDFDWQLSSQFLISAGAQELYSMYKSTGYQEMQYDIPFKQLELNPFLIAMLGIPPEIENDLRIAIPASNSPNSENNLFTTSGYVLTEYSSPGNRFNAELGLRLDHFYLVGDGFTASSTPALNPRLNLDFNILKDAGILKSLDLSAGSGLFSSVNDTVFMAEERFGIDKIYPNRSWTSILGLKFEFPESLVLNIEGYYKYVFDRMYVIVEMNPGEDVEVKPYFNGEGVIWGIDVMLQKIQSRYWDGWLSYSYSSTKYRDPEGRIGGTSLSGGNRGNDWYYPTFHRYHNLNLVFNYKPRTDMNLYMRFGIASGVPLSRRIGDKPESYPVLIFDRDNPTDSYYIEKYSWDSVIDESNRTTPSLPMDIKFSIFGNNKNGKVKYEVYVAIENVLGLLYTAQGNTSFNQYTGEVDTGSYSASYDLPIPIPSFGFKISY